MSDTTNNNNNNNNNNSIIQNLKDKIENLDKYHQIEILRIFKMYSETIKTDENKNGTFINLSNIPDNLIDKLESYLQYVNKQEEKINEIEEQKDEFKQLINN